MVVVESAQYYGGGSGNGGFSGRGAKFNGKVPISADPSPRFWTIHICRDVDVEGKNAIGVCDKVEIVDVAAVDSVG